MNRTARLVSLATLVIAAIGVAVDAVVGYSPFPGYGAAIGLAGCVAIIVVSSWLGRAFISRPESYYPLDVPPDVHEDHHG